MTGIGWRSNGDTRRNVFTRRVVRVWSELSESVGEVGSIEGFEGELNWYPERRHVSKLNPTPLTHPIPLPSLTPSRSPHSPHPAPLTHSISLPSVCVPVYPVSPSWVILKQQCTCAISSITAWCRSQLIDKVTAAVFNLYFSLPTAVIPIPVETNCGLLPPVPGWDVILK